MLYSVKLKGVSYRKKKINLFVCLEQLVDGLEGKDNITRQNFKKTYCGRDFSLNVFSSNLLRGRPILLNRLVPCRTLNFVFCFVSFEEDLTPKKLHTILTAVSLKSHRLLKLKLLYICQDLRALLEPERTAHAQLHLSRVAFLIFA